MVESVRQLVEAVHSDVTTMIGNCEALVGKLGVSLVDYTRIIKFLHSWEMTVN